MFKITNSGNVVMMYLYPFFHGQMHGWSIKVQRWWLVLDSVILLVACVSAAGCDWLSSGIGPESPCIAKSLSCHSKLVSQFSCSPCLF